MSTFYPVAFHQEDDSWAVLFPGLPGCQTYGRDFDHAQEMALEALETHLLGLALDNDPWPEPLSLQDAKAHEDSVGAEVLALLPAPPRPSKAKRLNISVPENWLAVIDAAAARAGLNRSAYLTHAALTQARRDKAIHVDDTQEEAA